MSDYIDREELMKVLKPFVIGKGVMENINAIPSADVRENRWIPVTERLPEENVHVLVTVLHEGKTYVTTDDYFCYGFDDWKDDVIAWQPLPEPYKAESEDKE